MLDQPKSFLPTPRLDFLLSRDSHANVAERLVMHQAKNPVALRESEDKSGPVLRDAPLKVVGDACVQVSRAACENVNVVGAAHTMKSNHHLRKTKADPSPPFAKSATGFGMTTQRHQLCA